MPDTTQKSPDQQEREKKRLGRLPRYSWMVRLFKPTIIAAAGATSLLLHHFVSISPELSAFLNITGRVLMVCAIGWSITTLVDWAIARHASRYRPSWEDNFNAQRLESTFASRRHATRLDVMRRIWGITGSIATLAAMLTVIPWARQIGVSLFASAGIAGIAVGIAARPVLSNLIAGLQIAFTQPIRIEDAVIVENEWGWVEEISLFYVVIRIWDWRRLVVPLSHFIEKPFQNWTRNSATIIGSIGWSVDYRTPIDEMREELKRICERSQWWDKKVAVLQVIEADHHAVRVRGLASAPTSPECWELRCFIREEMISWLQREHPEALPRLRAESMSQDDNGQMAARELYAASASPAE